MGGRDRDADARRCDGVVGEAHLLGPQASRPAARWPTRAAPGAARRADDRHPPAARGDAPAAGEPPAQLDPALQRRRHRHGGRRDCASPASIRRWSTMTAWQPHEALGRFYYDVLRPHDSAGQAARPTIVIRWCSAIATGQSRARPEMILLARDGQRVNVSVTAAAVRSPQGQPISGVLNVRDITRTRETEELRYDLRLGHLARIADADRHHQGLRLDAGARGRPLGRRDAARAAGRHRGGGRPAEPSGAATCSTPRASRRAG